MARHACRAHPERPPLIRCRVTFVGLALTLLGPWLAGCGAPAPDAVEVAIAVPRANDGLMLEARQAWQLVVDQINASGGIGDRPLHVHERDLPLDDTGDLGPLADGFVDLAEEGYKYIISLVSGGALGPMMDAAAPHGVLAMSITSDDPAADLPEADGLLLRGILPTDRIVQKQASLLQTEGVASIAIVGATIAGRPDTHQVAMQDAYARCEGCRVVSVTYPSEADLYRYDWETVGREATTDSPDAVYLASADVSAVLDTIFWVERAGFTGRYYFAYGGLMASAAAAMPGSRVPVRFRAHELALPPNARLDRFLTMYEARYGDSFVPEPRLIAFADYLSLLSLAMLRVGDDDPRAVAAIMKELAGPPGESYGTLEFQEAAQAVRAGRDIDFVGLSGPLDFDARGEVADAFIREYGVTPSGDVAALP